MSLKDIKISHSYISYGSNNIATALLNPALKQAKIYKRSVGFFSSGALIVLLEGISNLVRNGGHLLLIASPQLSEVDIQTISKAYDLRHKEIEGRFSIEFMKALEDLEDDHLKILLELISKNYMDIKIAVTKRNGIYHDKLGIITDPEGNSIAFYGSSNESYKAYCENYEKIRVARSWIKGEIESVRDEENEFDNLWNNANPFVDVFEYTECAKRHLIECISNRKTEKKENGQIQLRDYQEEAIQAWINNNYHGFYVMATGTGKTWTAIYSAKELLEKKDAIMVVCAPYKHLIKQWAEDIVKVFPCAKIIMVSSENSEWETQLTQSIIRKKYDKKVQIIVVSTITSFYLKRFITALMKSDDEKLLIVDEAHRFTKRPDVLNRMFHYMLGLSATPFSGKSMAKGTDLMDFFGGRCLIYL